jgi:hypothetical protein
LVLDKHPLGKSGVECTISHASIIRPIIDYLILATEGNIKITICDVPLQQANWDNLIKYSGLKKLVEFYNSKGFPVNLLDLRLDIAYQNELGLIKEKVRKKRDPMGYISVDLKNKSALQPIIKYFKKLEITDYPSGTVSEHHNFEKNEYLIPRTVLNSDLFINVPKLKTHRKTGITFALKNLIGINGDKSWIAHHRRGGVKGGGDEYPEFKLKNFLKSLWIKLKRSKCKWLTNLIFKFYNKIFMKGKTFAEAKYCGSLMKGVTEGSWYKNDTIWRCIIDINNILFFADKKGEMKKKQQRNYLCIGDGIISGEGEGPMENTPKKTGVVISGFCPFSVDKISSQLMGFLPNKINLIKKSKSFFFKKSDEIKIIKNKRKIQYNFKPPNNWKIIRKY